MVYDYVLGKTVRVYGGGGCGCTDTATINYYPHLKTYYIECFFCVEKKAIGRCNEVELVEYMIDAIVMRDSIPTEEELVKKFGRRTVKKHYRKIPIAS